MAGKGTAQGVPLWGGLGVNRECCLPNCLAGSVRGKVPVSAVRKEGVSFDAANCFQVEYQKKLRVETELEREARKHNVERCATKVREDEALMLVLEFTFIRRKNPNGLMWMKAC